MKRSLEIVIATLLVVLAAMGVASAQSVTRDLPSSVNTGATFNVTLNAPTSGTGVQVKETIPSGFSFESFDYSNADNVKLNQSGNHLTFTVTDSAADGFTITYTLTAASTTDAYTFSGTYEPIGQSVSDIGGDTQLNVDNPTPTPTVTVSPVPCPLNSVCRDMRDSVRPGNTFEVTLTSTVDTIGMNIDEVIPPGFKLVDWSYSGADNVELTVYNISSYYTITTNESSSVSVGSSYHSTTVGPDEIYNVTNVSHEIEISQGFTVLDFVVTDLASDGFTITYTLKAPEKTGCYTITGSYQPFGGSTEMIKGDTTICVGQKCLIYKNPGLDSDNDGWSDVKELEAGTNPFDSSDQPAKQDIVEVVTEWVKKYFSL